MSDDELNALIAELPTKAAKIRTLSDHGIGRADIARLLGIRYQHVRNVLISPRPKDAGKQKIQASASEGGGLTIQQAKQGLALSFGVPIDSIDIVIRG